MSGHFDANCADEEFQNVVFFLCADSQIFEGEPQESDL